MFYATCCELVDEPPGLKPDNLFESVEQLHAQYSAIADHDDTEVEATEMLGVVVVFNGTFTSLS